MDLIIKNKIETSKEINKKYDLSLSKFFSKLSKEDIDSLIKDKDLGMTIRNMSLKYGISIGSLSELLNGKSYKWYWEEKDKTL